MTIARHFIRYSEIKIN